MEFKDYLKEQIKKVDNEDKGLLLLIYLDEDIYFKYHKDCFADFQDDFCILYDGEVNMCFRYDSVTMMQIGDIDDIKKDMVDDLIRLLRVGEL